MVEKPGGLYWIDSFWANVHLQMHWQNRGQILLEIFYTPTCNVRKYMTPGVIVWVRLFLQMAWHRDKTWQTTAVTLSVSCFHLMLAKNSRMEVSWNRGHPKSSTLMGLSIINQPFWDSSIYGNPHIVPQRIPRNPKAREEEEKGGPRLGVGLDHHIREVGGGKQDPPETQVLQVTC